MQAVSSRARSLLDARSSRLELLLKVVVAWGYHSYIRVLVALGCHFMYVVVALGIYVMYPWYRGSSSRRLLQVDFGEYKPDACLTYTNMNQMLEYKPDAFAYRGPCIKPWAVGNRVHPFHAYAHYGQAIRAALLPMSSGRWASSSLAQMTMVTTDTGEMATLPHPPCCTGPAVCGSDDNGCNRYWGKLATSMTYGTGCNGHWG